MSLNIILNNATTAIPTADSTANTTFIEVIGNKGDASNDTADQASVIGLLRNVLANLHTDADVAALIGALDTAAATGAVTTTDVLMAYVKQLVTELQVVDGIADTILLDTAELQGDLTDGGRLDLLIDAIKAVTDALPNAGALTSLAQDSTVAKAASFGTLTNTGGTATVGGILGDVANSSIATRLTTLADILSGTTGIASFPAATAAGNGVSLAEVIRYISDSQIGGLVNSGGTATLASIIGDVANTSITARLDAIDNYIDTEVASIKAKTDNLPADTATTLTGIESKIDTIDNFIDGASLEKLTGAADGTDVYPATVVEDSVVAKILSKANPAVTTSYDNTTDSLEAISDKITAGVYQTVTVTTADASSTAWTVAAHRLFTVTGVVEIDKIFAVVSETVVEGAGADNTVSVGTSDDVDLMIGVTDGDALVANDIWANVAGTSTVKHALVANAESFIVSSTDIDINVLGTNSITDGTLVFYCTWKPISAGATVVAAAWD
jgi:hypothetical protein